MTLPRPRKWRNDYNRVSIKKWYIMRISTKSAKTGCACKRLIPKDHSLTKQLTFAAPTLVSSKMTSDWTTCQIEVVLQIGWKFALTNQKHYLIWQVVSSVWNFCTRFQTSFREKPVVALRKFGCFLRLNRTRLNSLTRLSFLGRHSNQKSHTTNGK